jgi:hypothetical protein
LETEQERLKDEAPGGVGLDVEKSSKGTAAWVRALLEARVHNEAGFTCLP